jgi:pSer/pThr/pTyr-binding forkhead associated (FHA) protein
LGASLAALDERMHGGAAKRDADAPVPHADFVTTLATDNGSDSPGPRPQSAELLRVQFEDGPRRGIVDVGERTHIEAGRKLVVTIEGRSFDYPILKRQMTIGRGHDSDIRVSSHFVSRVHARIRINGAATVIEDAGSKNGVLVNSERVLRRVLRDGDIVTLGDDCNMRFVDTTH